MKSTFKILLFTTSSIINTLLCQEIPHEFYEFKKIKYGYNFGKNRENYSTFGPTRFQNNFKLNFSNSDSLLIHTRYGILSKNSDLSIYGFGHLSYQKYFYGYLYSRIVNNHNAFPRYSGIPRKVRRVGFNSGETDLAGIGFQNKWAIFQIGRGRISVGAGDDIELALSENVSPYDYSLVQFNFGKIRLRSVNGFLETDSSSINRYISFRGIEYSNLNTFVISLSESVIYSGRNRPLDFAYLNPMSTHLEIELNNKQNKLGSDSGNGVWQLSLDWMLTPLLRFSGNLLFDEFVLDDVEKNDGNEHGYAFSAQIRYNISENELISFNSFLSIVQVGTPTFRHEDGNNNFVNRGKPLGWKYGSDGKEIKIGLLFHYKNKLYGNFEFGERKSGEESISYRPYEKYHDYIKGAFPSGVVDKRLFLSKSINWWWTENISITMGSILYDTPLDGTKFNFNFEMNIYYPIIQSL